MSDPTVVAVSLLVGLVSFTLGIGYLIAEPRSAATRAFALTVMAGGIATAFTHPLAFRYEAGGSLSGFLRFPIFELLAYLGEAAWLLQVARTAQLSTRMQSQITACVATICVMAAIYFVASALQPAQRITTFVCLARKQECVTEGFERFALPLGAAIVAYNVGLVSLLTQRIDRAERVRLNFVLLAVLFTYGAYYLPLGYGAISTLVGNLIMAIGFIRYYGIQSERGYFMSRFLSPEVSKVVRNQGIEHLMKPQGLELTAVCCDMRGFTRLSLLLATDQTIRLLNEYYETIGRAVAEFGGTIKDYAGDGVLILMGAPLAMPDHARQGLTLAHRLREVVAELFKHWVSPEMQLGFGIGVASGKVTVGAVGSLSRMEYTAVGPAVNLSSRLCALAADGEVLVDARTAELTGSKGLESRSAQSLKGFGQVAHFALPAGQGSGA